MITGIESCIERGADFILRIKNKPFNLYHEKKEKILLTDWRKTVKESVSETTVYLKDNKKNFQPLRICAFPKTEEEIKKEEKRLGKKESKKQITISDDTKFSHRYIFVVTSLPESFSAEDILKLYRLRWQVEMVFKRYKTILGLGSIPTKKRCYGSLAGRKNATCTVNRKISWQCRFLPLWESKKKTGVYGEKPN